jgi:hypothetical protein
MGKLTSFLTSVILRRWLRWLLWVVGLSAVGAVVLSALRWKPEAVHGYFAAVPPLQRSIVAFGAVLAAVFVAFKLLEPRLGHFNRAFLSHPPVWSAWALAVVVVGLLDLIFGLNPARFEATWEEWVGYLGGAVFLVVSHRFLTAKPSLPPPPPVSIERSADDIFKDWSSLAAR